MGTIKTILMDILSITVSVTLVIFELEGALKIGD